MASAKTEKFELLKAMNTIVRSLNHEGAYYDRWIIIVPDEATDEDLRDIAEDDDDEIFRDSVKCFEGIMRDYKGAEHRLPDRRARSDALTMGL